MMHTNYKYEIMSDPSNSDDNISKLTVTLTVSGKHTFEELEDIIVSNLKQKNEEE